MQYKVIREETRSCCGAIKNVEKQVNEHLEEGWALHGDLKILSHGDRSGFFVVAQALVKKDSEDM